MKVKERQRHASSIRKAVAPIMIASGLVATGLGFTDYTLIRPIEDAITINSTYPLPALPAPDEQKLGEQEMIRPEKELELGGKLHHHDKRERLALGMMLFGSAIMVLVLSKKQIGDKELNNEGRQKDIPALG